MIEDAIEAGVNRMLSRDPWFVTSEKLFLQALAPITEHEMNIIGEQTQRRFNEFVSSNQLITVTPQINIARPEASVESVSQSIQSEQLFQTLYPLILKIDWSNEQRCPRKAYVCACLSELSYFHLPGYELVGSNRYNLFTPSLAREALLKFGLPSLNLAEVIFPPQSELQTNVFVTKRYVYLIVYAPQVIIVAVRGTQQRDWMINFDVRIDDHFHGGFQREARTATSHLKDALKLRRYNPKKPTPLYFTGHSLGAAVAAILATTFNDRNKCKGPKVISPPYLFASPRFATAKASLPRIPYAYVAADDLVPHLPPRIWYAERSAIEIVPKAAERLSGPRTLFQWVFKSKNRRALHAIERYRHYLGLQIKHVFSETAYVDALATLKAQRDTRA